MARSPNRAMLRAVGFGDGDFDKPIVGVANGHSTITPVQRRRRSRSPTRAVAAHRARAARNAQVFGAPTVTDGIGDGHRGA